MQNHSVSFTFEAIARVTMLPREEGQSLLNAELPINAREWEVVFKGRNGSRMEYCVVCATFTTLMRGARYNWAEAIRLHMQEKIERQRVVRPITLMCASYMRVLCQLSVASSLSSCSRSVPPFLSPIGHIQSMTKKNRG